MLKMEVRKELADMIVGMSIVERGEMDVLLDDDSLAEAGLIWSRLLDEGAISQPQCDTLSMAEKGYIPIDAARVTVELHDGVRSNRRRSQNPSSTSANFLTPPPVEDTPLHPFRLPKNGNRESTRTSRISVNKYVQDGEKLGIETFRTPFPLKVKPDQQLEGNENNSNEIEVAAPTSLRFDGPISGFETDEEPPTEIDPTLREQPTEPFHTPIPMNSKKPTIGNLVGRQLGKYFVSAKLGKGASGYVFLAQHTTLDIPVAVKILDPALGNLNPQMIQRFLREARTAARINHPNVVRILDCDELDGFYIIAMEYVEGVTVADLIQMSGVVPENRALSISLAVTRGLEAALEAGIIHRDIKPANIMVTKTHQTKVADLGLGKLVHQNTDQELSDTASNVALGTPHFFAPEQARDAASVDHRADIYALGASMYNMLTGSYPFRGKSIAELIVKHQTEPLISPRDMEKSVSVPVSELVVKMMAKDPNDRPQDYRTLTLLIQECITLSRSEQRIEPGTTSNITSFISKLFKKKT